MDTPGSTAAHAGGWCFVGADELGPVPLRGARVLSAGRGALGSSSRRFQSLPAQIHAFRAIDMMPGVTPVLSGAIVLDGQPIAGRPAVIPVDG